MGKGTKKDALANSGTANQYSAASNSKANSLYNELNPIYTAEATNPEGYGDKDLAAINTASQQSLGGGQAAAAGEGSLTAARTRNAGGFAPAIAESARSGMRQNSQNALNVQGQNAALKQNQKQAGISGLSGLYGQNSQEALQALGLSNQAIGVANGVPLSVWQNAGQTAATNLANNATQNPRIPSFGG